MVKLLEGCFQCVRVAPKYPGDTSSLASWKYCSVTFGGFLEVQHKLNGLQSFHMFFGGDRG